jgi:hypothetical protein
MASQLTFDFSQQSRAHELDQKVAAHEEPSTNDSAEALPDHWRWADDGRDAAYCDLYPRVQLATCSCIDKDAAIRTAKRLDERVSYQGAPSPGGTSLYDPLPEGWIWQGILKSTRQEDMKPYVLRWRAACPPRCLYTSATGPAKAPLALRQCVDKAKSLDTSSTDTLS